MTTIRSSPGPGSVLLLGGANMDVAASAAHPLLAGESNPGQVRCAPGGVARNVAENLARLGHDTRLVSLVGDDLYGRSLLAATRRAGVNVRGCQVLPGRGTATYVSLHGADGEMALAVNDMEILEELTPERLQSQLRRVREAAALVLDCNLPCAALDWLFMQPRRGPVFVDAVSAFKAARIRPWLARLHTLKVNRLEAAALSGIEVLSLADARAAASWLVRQGVHRVVLTMGAQGACWLDRDGAQGVQPTLSVPMVNATGAGDALLAGLVHSHLAGNSLAQAIQFAAGCAALTLTSPAATHPGLSLRAVRKLLAAFNRKRSKSAA